MFKAAIQSWSIYFQWVMLLDGLSKAFERHFDIWYSRRKDVAKATSLNRKQWYCLCVNVAVRLKSLCSFVGMI